MGSILLVDDDRNFLHLIEDYLQGLGYTVTTARDGREALQLLAHLEPDLIIIDLVLPEMDGFELLERMKAIPTTSWVPVILTSAKLQPDDRAQGLYTGANAFIAKPFDLKEFMAQVRSCLQISALLKKNQIKKSPRLQAATDVKLTGTETLVAKLVALGLSNQEIAIELNISKRTVESHISHMLRKTELSNRTELSRWILESGYVF